MNGKNEEANVWSWRTVAQLFGTHYKISWAPAKDEPAIMWRVNYYDRAHPLIQITVKPRQQNHQRILFISCGFLSRNSEKPSGGSGWLIRDTSLLYSWQFELGKDFINSLLQLFVSVNLHCHTTAWLWYPWYTDPKIFSKKTERGQVEHSISIGNIAVVEDFGRTDFFRSLWIQIVTSGQ